MATLNVGAGQTYATLSAAVGASRDGDVIAVQAGTYVNDFATISKDITIVGVGGMANFVATVAPPNGKGIFVIQGNVTIQNLSFSGAAVSDGNGAGIRYEGGNLVVIDSYFHDNQMNLLANSVPNGTIRIVGSEFGATRDSDSLNHNLYVGNIASLVIDDSYFHDANDGHQIKSRAQSTTITNSRIYDGTGAGSYTIDLPNGGVGVIRNNVIEQGPNSDNPFIIAYGEEGGVYAGSSLLIQDNLVVNDLSGNSVLLYNAATINGIVSSNSIWGLTAGQMVVGSATVFGTTFLSTHPTLDTSSGGGGGDDASLSIAALSADKVEGQSGSTPFTFTVTRGGNTSIASSASWAVTGSGANAAAGSDFAGGALPSGTVSFAAGETSKTITVNVAGDTIVEPDEGFTVTLSNAAASTTIGTASASGTIRNDDGGQASLSIAALSADKVEGQSGSTPFTFTVMRGGNTSIASSANWAVTGSGANAAAGSDFAGGGLPSGTVSFAAGETSKTITVNVAGDTVVEPDEGFTVTLSNPAASTTIAMATASGTIRNDETSQASLSIAALSADKVEGQSGSTPFTFTVTRGGNTSVASSANWAVTGSSANPAAGSDFAGGALPSGTVSFAAGQTSKTITVNVAGDTVVEPDEGFTVTLSNPSSGATAAASGTIRNDDVPTATIEAFGATRLVKVGNQFQLLDASNSGPTVKYQGGAVTAGQFGAWTPLGAEKIGTGYQVVWQNGSADQYLFWNTDSTGTWKSQSDPISGSSYALQSLETTFQQDFNHDGTTGLKTTPIETAGVTDLFQVANEFFLRDAAGNGPSLKYAGADVVTGQFGAWTPLGAEKIGTGYQVVWQNGSADQYLFWNTDSNGTWKSQSDPISGSSYALQSLEATLQQDFNHDGTTGLKTTPIETAGATDLFQVANEFFLRDAAGNGPSLKYAGADVVTGQFGAWTPLGAEKIGTGYQVVWKNGNADQYLVWNTDSNGNWKSQSDPVSGSSYALQSLEATFQQDFNHDGTTGLKTTTIETAGATHLDQVANEFFLRNTAGSGPSLKYAGSDVVADQFGAWTPLGAEKTANGYEVAWQNGAANQYVIWDVDNNGNWKSQSDLVSGSSPALKAMETILHQDLNHDTIIG